MRQNELEKKQLEMASIVKILNSQIEELDWIHTQKAQVLESLNNIYNSQDLDVITISNSDGYLAKLGNDEKKQNRVIENSKNILRIKQLEITELYKKVKVLEKLKEKQEKEYYKSIEMKEAKEVDDIVTTRYKVS